eukprot:g47500.t1
MFANSPRPLSRLREHKRKCLDPFIILGVYQWSSAFGEEVFERTVKDKQTNLLHLSLFTTSTRSIWDLQALQLSTKPLKPISCLEHLDHFLDWYF